MVEWFTNNASAIIAAASALFAAIIAAISTLLSVALSHRANKSQRDETFSRERWKLNRDLYLSKAEEIFSLFNIWYENAYQVMLLQVFIVIGTKPQEQALEEMKPFIDKQLSPKITALLSLYYGDLLGDFEAIAKKINEINTIYTKALTGQMGKTEFAINADQKFSETKDPVSTFMTKLAELSKTKM